MWEGVHVAVPPEPAQTSTSPRFKLGSVVLVLADTTPGVHPMHAEGVLVAKVLDFADEGHYYDAPFGSKRCRRVGCSTNSNKQLRLMAPLLCSGFMGRAAEALHVARP